MRAYKFKGFEATGETEKVCFNGWDGKSYNGESETLPTYRLDPRTSYAAFNAAKRYVPKYTRKWGWTMHEIEYNWDKIGDAYEVSFSREVEREVE